MKKFLLLLIFLSPLFLLGQSFTSVREGALRFNSTWEGGVAPPFQFFLDKILVPASVELHINHELATYANEIINNGNIYITLSDTDSPTINWRNQGNMTMIGWSPDSGSFINTASGNMLFQSGAQYCQHMGCGSENYGTIYVNTCLSNICAVDSSSRFLNHPIGEIRLCPDGYIENYWFLPNAGSIANVSIINNGTILYDDSWQVTPVYNVGNDFFNGNPNSMGMYSGNEPVSQAAIECIDELPDISTSLEELKQSNLVHVYPNPTSGMINIQSTTPYDFINVYDNFGRLQTKIQPDQTTYNLNGKKGIYIFQMVKQSEIISYKKVVLL